MLAIIIVSYLVQTAIF